MLWHNLLLFECSFKTNYTLSDFSDISQVVIAVVNLFLAGYIFIYQKNQNSKADIKSAKLNEQNIRLQWFKELIIQPNYKHLLIFFENLESLKAMVSSDNMSDEEIVAINRYINDQAAQFRINFYDITLKVNNDIYRFIKKEVEDLVTILTKVFSDDENKLSNDKTFQREVIDHVRYTKHNIIAKIYSYKGE